MSLGKELFQIVEADQGFSFVSDALEDWPDLEVLALVRDTVLPHARSVVRKLEEFLRANSAPAKNGAAVDLARLRSQKLSPERRLEISRAANKARMKRVPPLRRQEIAKLAAAARWGSRKSGSARPSE